MATITDTTTDANGNIIVDVSSSADDSIALATAGNYSDKNIIFNLTTSTKKTTVTLSTNWTGSASPYTQTVTISGTTANSKVDLQPDTTTITQMADDGTIALYISNENGTLTANAVGEKPTVALTIQATITEVSA